jgi:hypothetical protein
LYNPQGFVWVFAYRVALTGSTASGRTFTVSPSSIGIDTSVGPTYVRSVSEHASNPAAHTILVAFLPF